MGIVGVLCVFLFSIFIPFTSSTPLGYVNSQASLTYAYGGSSSGLSSHQEPLQQTQQTSTESYKYDVFRVKTYGREEAVTETEGIISQFDTKYSKAQNFFDREPIIDNIKEHEKYGNSGGTSTGIGKAVVGGFEIFSNLVNGVLEKPKEAGAVFSKNLNTFLGSFGAKLIG